MFNASPPAQPFAAFDARMRTWVDAIDAEARVH
jgi:hypothetical protein